MPGPTEPDRRPAERFARAVAYTINPIVLAPLFFGWVASEAGWPSADVLRAVVLTTASLSLVPLVVLWWMVRTGRAENLEVRSRARRGMPFLAALSGATGALAASFALDWPTRPLLEPLVACFVANTVVLGAVTTRFKISLHAASVSGFVSMAAWLGAAQGSPDWAVLVPAAGCIPLVAWARVRDHAHSTVEVAAGTAFGLVVPPLELEILAHLGWLIAS